MNVNNLKLLLNTDIMLQTEAGPNDIFDSIAMQIKDVNNYPISGFDVRFLFCHFVEKGESFLKV